MGVPYERGTPVRVGVRLKLMLKICIGFVTGTHQELKARSRNNVESVQGYIAHKKAPNPL